MKAKDPLTLMQLDKVPNLVRKYKSVVALPLDLPKLELDNAEAFWDTWDKEVGLVTRQHVDRGAIGIDKPEMNIVQWEGLAVYENLLLINKLAWNTNLSSAMANSQRNYINQIIKSLDFMQLRSIRFWSAVRDIPAHYDGNMPETLDGVQRFPAEIRIMLYDENPSSTFWLVNANKHNPHTTINDSDKFYIKLPESSNTFIWNNEEYLHGADYDPKYKKILVVIKGWITNMDKLELLLDQSIEKYPGHVIRETI